MTSSGKHRACERVETAFAHALGRLDAGEAASFEAHLAACEECRDEVDSLRRIVASFADWPSDSIRPSGSVWERLSGRIGASTATPAPGRAGSPESEWIDVGPGIAYKPLAADRSGDRISMLVRLAPGAAYPPHVHAGVEELHLLDGELWIEDRKLLPGDYNRAEAGTADTRVWSETGCTCVLITSGRDALR
jgi:anti-sigma factor ChrR (cupin superfamily)